MPTVPHPQLEMDNSNSNSFCSCLKYGWATKKVWKRGRRDFFADRSPYGWADRLLCDCGEMSAGDADTFDWNFEGGELTETAFVRILSRGRGINFLHAGGSWRSEKAKVKELILKLRRKCSFFSEGNAVCRGNSPLSPDCLHFWEIKPDVEVYGNAAVIGIATSNFDVVSATRSYHSGLGKDQDGESWGYNYGGEWIHKSTVTFSQKKVFPRHWGVGSIIGVLLDRWKGTLEYYLNREPLGVAFRGKIVYHLD